VARRVFIHLGLPKTATTFLQTILWGSRDRLRADGVLLPGDERRDHLWASRVVREDPNPRSIPSSTARRGPDCAKRWRRGTETVWSAMSSSPPRRPGRPRA
jgi:hypothetical protein